MLVIAIGLSDTPAPRPATPKLSSVEVEAASPSASSLRFAPVSVMPSLTKARVAPPATAVGLMKVTSIPNDPDTSERVAVASMSE